MKTTSRVFNMKWVFIQLGTRWRKRYIYGYTEAEEYIQVCQQWALKIGEITIWKKWKPVGEITVNEWVARAPMGLAVITPQQRILWTPTI
jgi:hypothetical protein